MNLQKQNINLLWASLLIEELCRNRITYFCISPGSRSAPLTIAAARHPYTECKTFYDERGAAYHALGYTRATEKPAVLISTSGTAAVNYFPAVIEAYQDHIPLIVLTADRPPELLDTGANQTIDQTRLYGNYIRWFFDLPCPDEKIKPSFILSTVDQAIRRILRGEKGPVHLNCRFREPLEPSPQKIGESYLKEIDSWINSAPSYITDLNSRAVVPQDQLKTVAERINRAKRGILAVGRLNSSRDRKMVRHFAGKLGFPIFADILSGLRLGNTSPNLIAYSDYLLNSEKFSKSLKPDVIIHLGSPLISKRFLQYLEKFPPENYITVVNHSGRIDPLHTAAVRIESDIEEFCKGMENYLSLEPNTDFSSKISQINMMVDEEIENILNDYSLPSEPFVARCISKNIIENSGLYVSSSLPIREMDMFADPRGVEVPVAANRGVSGIDGTVAGAAGFAKGLEKPVTLLIGDMAFIHDLNSLSLIESLKQPLIIVLINNRGGGIFSFLPVSNFKEVFETYFEVPHDLNFKHAAAIFGLQYYCPETQVEFQSIYQEAQKQAESALIEIHTGKSENYSLHQTIRDKVIQLLEKV